MMNRNRKIKVLYDVRALEEESGFQRGIFVVAYNILKELMKRPELKVKIYAGTDYHAYLRTKPFIDSQTNMRNQPKFFHGDIRDFDIFLSPRHSIPNEIKKTGIICYTIIHDLIPMVCSNDWEDLPFFDIIKSLTWEDYIFSISDFTKRDIIKLLPQVDHSKITKISLAAGANFYPCIDMECNRRIRIKYGIPVDKRYVFSLSALEPRKNLIFAIRNFVKFIEQNHIDDLVFVIAGCINNDFEEVFNAELSKFGKNSTKVIKTGHVENDALAPLYSHAECCVFVSLYEGFGLPPLEAMQCGCPVIASNVTSIPEVVGSAGILIDPTNDEAMIAAYEKIYYGEELRKELSKKGIERAKNFSWKACVDVMVREFKKHDFKQPRSSCIISIPQCSILQALKRFFKKFIFDISNRPTKTKMMMFCFEIFKIKRKYKEKIFYVFGIPIFKKRYKSVIVR